MSGQATPQRVSLSALAISRSDNEVSCSRSDVTDEHGGEHREVRLVGETQAVKVGRLEPRHSVVFVRHGVDGCSGPPVDQPDLHVERRGPDLMHQRAGRLRRRDPQLLPKLADKALLRVLPLVNMTARQIPYIGIPTPPGASMTQQHPIAGAKNGRNNPDRTGVVSGDRADAAGSRLAPPVADYFCGAYLDRSSAWREAIYLFCPQGRCIGLSDCLRAVTHSSGKVFE
jgi:hypothetical protein